MSVVSVIIQSHLRTGSVSYDSAGDSDRVYLVRTDDPNDDDGVVLAASGLPAIRSNHPTRLNLRCTLKRARQSDEKCGLTWEVICSYGYIPAAEDFFDIPKYAWGHEPFEAPLDKDVITNAAVLNSAGQPFDPTVTQTLMLPVMSVTWNTLTDPSSWSTGYCGRVNSATWKGHAAGLVWCRALDATQEIFQDESSTTLYWAVSAQFVIHFKTWQAEVLDAGFMEKDAAGKLIPIIKSGREVSSPWPLDGSGKALAESSTAYVWKTYNRLKTANFNSLPI